VTGRHAGELPPEAEELVETVHELDQAIVEAPTTDAAGVPDAAGAADADKDGDRK
jgi:branched-chain amino acid transport system ATP-binding protein